MIGSKFNRLEVIGLVRVGEGHDRRIDWQCRCDCGNIVTRRARGGRSGHAKSCGCLAVERIGNMRRTHGMSHLPIYLAWQNEKDPHWENYGGRGIAVCDRWKAWENFYADMGDRPTPKHTIDRINNDGNYEPGNCRWATRKEQLENTRRSVINRAKDGWSKRPMNAEIPKLGQKLLDKTADYKADATIRMRRSIIATNLRELAKRPDEEELQALTLANMQGLAGKVVEVQKARNAHREKVV